MLLLSVLVAAACDLDAALAALPASGARDDYLCIVEAEAGKDRILAALLADPAAKNERLTRALALWLLRRTDRPMDPTVVDRLAPADRRLLADGIRARRGRASPAPEHAKVFEQFAWYTPVPTYTDAKLRPIDRENLLVVDPPVRRAAPAPEATPPTVAPTPAAPPAAAKAPNFCGCASASGPVGGLGALAALGLAARGLRRRR